MERLSDKIHFQHIHSLGSDSVTSPATFEGLISQGRCPYDVANYNIKQKWTDSRGDEKKNAYTS